jgi:hypothetical protein
MCSRALSEVSPLAFYGTFVLLDYRRTFSTRFYPEQTLRACEWQFAHLELFYKGSGTLFSSLTLHLSLQWIEMFSLTYLF